MCTLQDAGLRITLLRTAAGNEKDAVDAWSQRIKQPPPGITAAFLTLGRSDLLFVDQPKLGAEDEFAPGGLPGVIGSKQIDCYAWQGSCGLEQILSKPLCLISFLRLNGDLSEVDAKWTEVKIECELANRLQKVRREEDPPIVLLGTYGRAANVLVVGADETQFGAAFEATRNFIAGALVDLGTPSKPFALLRESYTNVAVRWLKPEDTEQELRTPEKSGPEIIADQLEDPNSRLRTSYPLNRCGSYLRDALVCIELRARSADIFALAKRAAAFWQAQGPDVRVTFGPADLHIRFPLKSYTHLGALVADLHDFRRDYQEAMINSEACLEITSEVPKKARCTLTDDFESFIDEPWVLGAPIDLEPDVAIQIARMDPEAPAIIHTFRAYDQRCQDDGGDAIRDMIPFYRYCRELALDASSKFAANRIAAANERIERLYSLLAHGQLGQLQRLDTAVMSRRAWTDLGPYRSGIRRLLWAAQTIPEYVLTRLVEDHKGYRGFVIAGQLRDVFATEPPVMTIPADALRHPERWWPLTHEAMHDYILRSDIVCIEKLFVTKEWEDSIKAILEIPDDVKNGDLRVYCKWLARECLCDMLEYLSLGALSWMEQQKITWSYIVRQIPRQVDERVFLREHFVRSCCVLRCANPAMTVEEVCGELLPVLTQESSACLTAAISDTKSGFRDKCESWANGFRSLAPWLMKHNPFNDAVIKQRQQWGGKRDKRRKGSAYSDCRDQLRKGELVAPNQLAHPDLIVWLLQSEYLGYELPFKMANAVSLSLLWYYLQDLFPDPRGA